LEDHIEDAWNTRILSPAGFAKMKEIVREVIGATTAGQPLVLPMILLPTFLAPALTSSARFTLLVIQFQTVAVEQLAQLAD
jgi:hypothetical protein